MERFKNLIDALSRGVGLEPAYFFTVGFVAAMLLVCALYFLRYWKPLNSGKRIIEQLVNELHTIPIAEERLNTMKTQLTSEDMRERYAVFFRQWRQYSRHVLAIYRKDFSTVGAEEYFNFESLSGDVNVALWHNLGSIFTGLGILGTFVGFSWGLITIDKIGSAESVNQLLSGIQTAFFTSIAGILFALAFNFWHGKFTHSFQATVEEFASIVDDLIPLTTQESLLAQILRESNRQTESLHSLKQGIQDDVREILEEMQDKMNEGISKAFSNSVNENFKPVFEELTTSIRSLSETGEKAIVKELKKGAGKALDKFKKEVGEMNEKMRETLEGSVAAMNTVKDAMEASAEQADSATKAAKDLVEVLHTETSNMKKTFDDGTSQLAAAASPLVQTIELLQQSSQDTRNSVSQIAEAVRIMGQTAQDIKDFYGNQKQIFEVLSTQISTSAQQLDQSIINSLTRYDRSIGDALLGLESVASVLSTTGENLTKDVRYLHTMTGGIRR